MHYSFLDHKCNETTFRVSRDFGFKGDMKRFCGYSWVFFRDVGFEGQRYRGD